jgi:hypothetical protein
VWIVATCRKRARWRGVTLTDEARPAFAALVCQPETRERLENFDAQFFSLSLGDGTARAVARIEAKQPSAEGPASGDGVSSKST